jgi:hypothetical protein
MNLEPERAALMQTSREWAHAAAGVVVNVGRPDYFTYTMIARAVTYPMLSVTFAVIV